MSESERINESLESRDMTPAEADAIRQAKQLPIQGARTEIERIEIIGTPIGGEKDTTRRIDLFEKFGNHFVSIETTRRLPS